ncbi:YncE family protein [Guyparkeria halophila]|uniref:YncE family protein n=1 Tax=Guyparkeria halophila TaxID=47960 RepID=UPI0018CBFB23|nr:YncE family protein [Guyparkeria halophila]
MSPERLKKLLLPLAFALPFGGAHGAPTVYIPLGSGDEVIAVDAATDEITATYTGLKNPHGLVATPDGEYLVAGSLSERPLAEDEDAETPNSKLYLVHPVHGHVMMTIPVAGWTHHEAITPDGRYVVSTHPTRGGVSVVDLRDNQVVETIQTGPAPNYTLMAPNGKTAFVSNSGNGTISEIDLPRWTVKRTLQGGPSPEHLVLSSDGQTIYATNPRAGTISAVSVDSGKVTESFHIGDGLHGLDIGDDGKTLFASARSEDKLVAINPATDERRTLTLSPAPYHLDTIHGTGKVYVSSSNRPVIWVVDQTTMKRVGTIDLPGGEAHQMAVVP